MIEENKEITVEVESHLGTRWLYEYSKAKVLEEKEEFLIVMVRQRYMCI